MEFLSCTDDNYIFFLDNIDNISDRSELIKWSENLLQLCKHARVMITTRTSENDFDIEVNGFSDNK